MSDWQPEAEVEAEDPPVATGVLPVPTVARSRQRRWYVVTSLHSEQGPERELLGIHTGPTHLCWNGLVALSRAQGFHPVWLNARRAPDEATARARYLTAAAGFDLPLITVHRW